MTLSKQSVGLGWRGFVCTSAGGSTIFDDRETNCKQRCRFHRAVNNRIYVGWSSVEPTILYLGIKLYSFSTIVLLLCSVLLYYLKISVFRTLHVIIIQTLRRWLTDLWMLILSGNDTKRVLIWYLTAYSTLKKHPYKLTSLDRSCTTFHLSRLNVI